MYIKLFQKNTKLNRNLVNIISKYTIFDLKSLENLYQIHNSSDGKKIYNNTVNITIFGIDNLIIKCVKNGFYGFRIQCQNDYNEIKNGFKKYMKVYPFITCVFMNEFQKIDVYIKDTKIINNKLIDYGLLNFM